MHFPAPGKLQVRHYEALNADKKSAKGKVYYWYLLPTPKEYLIFSFCFKSMNNLLKYINTKMNLNKNSPKSLSVLLSLMLYFLGWCSSVLIWRLVLGFYESIYLLVLLQCHYFHVEGQHLFYKPNSWNVNVIQQCPPVEIVGIIMFIKGYVLYVHTFSSLS